MAPADALSVRPGRHLPWGAHLATDPDDGTPGVHFAVFSRHATAIEVRLAPADNGTAPSPRVALQNLGHGRWARFVPGLRAGQRYVLHADGPWDPAQGHCFNQHRPLIDPWACALLGDIAPLAYRTSAPPGPAHTLDPQLHATVEPPHCAVLDQAAELVAGARVAPRPQVPHHRVVLYETQIKALTQQHPEVPPALRGTYAGLATAPVLAHLKGLGITTLCLLPVHQRLSERHLQDRGLTNHWGYNPLQVFAPDPRFAACTDGQPPDTPEQAQAVRDEFRQMVDTLHRHGLEVVLDVVFNHTAEGDLNGPSLSWRGLDNASWYALNPQGQPHNFSGCGNSLNLGDPVVTQWAMDSLRWWVQVFGVDGFRFDLATTLGRQAEHGHAFSAHAPLLVAMTQDPILAGVRLIAEPWDLGPDGYRLGQFAPGWQEWNDRFRDTTRAFWLGHPCTPGDMARALMGSSDRFHHSGRLPLDNIHFITAHDGFTLADLTTYTERRNLANGEQNRDGHAHNLGANAGTEGPSDNPKVCAQRQRWQRALLATLFVSQGTPQLLAGDELGHSQQGNNNAYCQDNAITWLDWAGTDTDAPTSLVHWVQALSALRRRYPGLRRAHWYTGQPTGTPGRERHCPLHVDELTHTQDGATPCPAHCPWLASCQGPDIVWQGLDGRPMTPPRWNDPHTRSLACVITVGDDDQLPCERLLLALHAGPQAQPLTLPAGEWTLLLDTSLDTPVSPDAPIPAPTCTGHRMQAPSSLVLLAQPLLPGMAAADTSGTHIPTP